MNRKDELKALILKALDAPKGIIIAVTGQEPGRRSLAVAALTAAKRELMPDVPEVLNISIKPIPTKEDQIAIMKLPPIDVIDV